jgi:SAM-dependent methyltransferase
MGSSEKLKTWLRKHLWSVTESEPYSESAAIYDRLMNHVDYQEWADYVHRMIQTCSLPVRRVVDAACGTGSLIRALRRFGYRTAGFDLSWNMAFLARRKTGGDIWQGDLTMLSLKPGQEAVVCLYDSVQYLAEEQLEKFLQEVYTLLKMGGILIFDAVTRKHVRAFWCNFAEKGRNRGIQYIRESWYEPENAVQHTLLRMKQKSPPRESIEHHRQYVYKIRDLRRMLRDIGFTVKGPFSEYTFERGGEDSHRVHFLAVKEEH